MHIDAPQIKIILSCEVLNHDCVGHLLEHLLEDFLYNIINIHRGLVLILYQTPMDEKWVRTKTLVPICLVFDEHSFTRTQNL